MRKLVLVGLWVVALVPWIALASVVRSGLSARVKPSVWEAWAATRLRGLATRDEVRTRKNPFTASESLLREAQEHFADHCAICHANDGSGKTALGQGLSPLTPDMRLAATQLKSDGELYSIIHHGIRFSGMPAWGTEGNDNDSWKLVLFIRHLPHLTLEEIKDMERYNPKSDAERAEEQMEEDFLNGKSNGASGREQPQRQR